MSTVERSRARSGRAGILLAVPRRRRWRRLAAALALTAPPCALLLAAALLVARAESIPVAWLLRDTVAVLDAPFYTGLVSNVGILLWSACVAICAFTAAVVKCIGRGAGEAGFFSAAALLSAWLLADDALLLHEQVLPVYLGLPGRLSLVVALPALGVFVLVFRRRLLAGDYPILLASLGLFAASVLLDQLHDLHLLWRLGLRSGGLQIMLEDGCKLLGIALWLGHFTLAARDSLVERGDDERPHR